MPLFYFHICDGRDPCDPEGIELPDVATAKREAVRLAGLALSDDADRVVARCGWTLDVTGGDGRLLYHVAVQTSDGRIPEPEVPSRSDPRAR